MSRLDEIQARVDAFQRAKAAKDVHSTDTAIWKLIDHAREDVPYLLARVRQLEAGLEEYADHQDGCASQRRMNNAEYEAARHNPSWRPPACTCGLAALESGFQVSISP